MSKLKWPTIHAWALYDFAATAFYMNMVSTYFALWVVKDQGASDLTYGIAKSLSMLVVALISPLVGAMSDRAGTRRPFIAVSVLFYVACSIVLGFTGNLWLGLALFGLANIALQLSTVFYNAMLPSLAPPSAMGRISGYGKMLGYVGSLVAVLLGMAFATGKILGVPLVIEPGGSQAVFIPTAILALLAAVPLMVMRQPRNPVPTAHASWRKLVTDLRDTKALPGVGLFLLASFFFFDTINTVRDFMSIYLVRVVGLSETGGSLQSFLLVVVLCSLVGALGWGFLTDKIGPKRALVGVLLTMAVGFVGLVVVHSPTLVLAVFGPIVGIGFGGVMVTTRPLLASLVPAERQGEFFGLFVLTNDFAAILGPLTWGVIVELLKAQGVIAYQAALGCQLVFLLIGIALLLKVRVPNRPAEEVAA